MNRDHLNQCRLCGFSVRKPSLIINLGDAENCDALFNYSRQLSVRRLTSLASPFRLFKLKKRYRNVLDTMFELFPRMARYWLNLFGQQQGERGAKVKCLGLGSGHGPAKPSKGFVLRPVDWLLLDVLLRLQCAGNLPIFWSSKKPFWDAFFFFMLGEWLRVAVV